MILSTICQHKSLHLRDIAYYFSLLSVNKALIDGTIETEEENREFEARMNDKKGLLDTGANNVNYGIRTAVLILLCCQNAGHALLARYSQGILKESYSSTEVVLAGEVIKLVASGYLAVIDRSETGEDVPNWFTIKFIHSK